MPRSAPESGTFVFADIAGYTALTEAHGDADAAELAGSFCREISGLARSSGGELIKTIGDAVMVRHDDPSEAVRLGLAAAHDVLAGHGFPAVRVGTHHGPAINREEPLVRRHVNLAARVAAVAGGGEVLVTEAVRQGAGELEGVEFESRATPDAQRGRAGAALRRISPPSVAPKPITSTPSAGCWWLRVARRARSGTGTSSIASARWTAPADSCGIQTPTRRPERRS